MIPPTILVYLVIAAVIAGGGYAIKESLEEKGAEKVRAEVAVQVKDAQLDAHEHRMRAQWAIDAVAREREALVTAKREELKGLHNERAGDAGGDDVVFDERWSDWVRGSKRRPGG
jgi:hypothetical protein